MKERLISGISTIWKIFWRCGLFFLVWGLLLALFFVPLGKMLNVLQHTSPIKVRLFGDSISLLTILAATWLMTRFLDRRPFLTIGLSPDHFLKYFLTGSAIGFTWLGASIGIAWISGWALPTQIIGFSWSLLAGTALSMLLNVIAQELLLCGFIFQTIRRHSNTMISIVVSAILFSGYHAGAFKGEWLPAINVFAAGVLFCLAYITTESLWFPIFIHYTWDVLVGPLLGLTESGRSDLGAGWKMIEINGPSLFTGGRFGLEGGLIVTLTVFSVIIFLYNYRRKKIRISGESI
jgi:uncharacterized protein